MRLLAAIARAVLTHELRTKLLACTTIEEVMALLGPLPARSLRSARTSLGEY